MFRKLRADEIDCRISMTNQYGVGLLLYKDARCDQNILDETVGPYNWQRKHEVIDGRLYCSVGLYDSAKAEWIWKQDVGTESYTEKEKGQASDSFKRACFNWGIGRELYTAPDMWVYPENLKTLKQDVTKWTCRDAFTVESIEYDDNRITYVKLRNEKTGKAIEFGSQEILKEPQRISAATAKVLESVCERLGIKKEKLLYRYGAKDYTDLTDEAYASIMNRINKYEGAKDGV